MVQDDLAEKVTFLNLANVTEQQMKFYVAQAHNLTVRQVNNWYLSLNSYI